MLFPEPTRKKQLNYECRSTTKRMIAMSFIPCKEQCVYQSNGICSLNCTASVGMPALGGACIRIIPEAAVRLESPHRYCEPELAADLQVQAAYLRGAQESDTV